jgi:hypothetical protein
MGRTADPKYVYNNEAGNAKQAIQYSQRFTAQRSDLEKTRDDLERRAAAGEPGLLQQRVQLTLDIQALDESVANAGLHGQSYMLQGDDSDNSDGRSKHNVLEVPNPSNPTNVKTPTAAEKKATETRLTYQLVEDTDFDTQNEKTSALNIAQKDIVAADTSVQYYADLNSKKINPQAAAEADLLAARNGTLSKTKGVMTSADATPLQKATAIDTAFDAEHQYQATVNAPVSVQEDIVGYTPPAVDDLQSGVPTADLDNLESADGEVAPVVVEAAGPPPPEPDFRVRIRAKTQARDTIYGPQGSGLMAPLWETNGVIFPFTPTIAYSHAVNYTQLTPTHSNTDYQVFTNAVALQMQITAVFSAQNKQEAEYMLACLHFFRSITKMRFGENDPLAGLPPPVVLLSGYGQYMFNDLPVIINTFTMDLPNNVDYIQVEHEGSSTWLPAMTTFNLTVTVQTTPEQQRKFDWAAFANGSLMRDKGWL